MKTQILKPFEIEKAAKIIKKGGIVAFPTETVYGLGADAFNLKAVKKIYIAKKRPFDNPLIFHVCNFKQVKFLTKKIPLKAKKIIKKFWPGPLTIILKKSKNIPIFAAYQANSIAIRIPKNKIALDLIKKSNCPIVAPSANSSGKPSSTELKHVLDDLSGKIDAVIDGGKTEIGIESTVIDFTENIPVILRPGIITKKQIEKIIGAVKNYSSLKKEAKKEKFPKSPGMKYKHYAPKAKIILVQSKNYFLKIKKFIDKNKNKKIGIICFNKKEKYPVKTIFLGNTPKLAAKKLFASFRKFDNWKIELILVEPIKETDDWEGVKNRLLKAASKII